ncbi:MAG: sugar phosphate isomerase/epimerase, partial [Succinivibrio sp.]|nr:sugar phosphate isomerase/epimerase [Succinivibrio sp.]
ACWPEAKAERRYAGVSHINCEKVLEDDSYAKHVLEVAKDNGVEISSLAFYPNTLDPDLKKRHDNVEHLKNVIRASNRLGINMVTTFIGRDQNRNFEDNLLIVKEVWPEILDLAKELGVKVAIENCPMLFGPDQWPGGQNLMTTPHNWKRIFEILDYDNLGINYDPSHFVWQMIDYVEPVYEFKDKIFHVHFKDLKVLKSKLNQVGILAYPLDFMAPKLPGLGDVNFSRFVSALTDIGYNGYACVEVEDRSFEDTPQRILDSLTLSYRYMKNFVI